MMKKMVLIFAAVLSGMLLAVEKEALEVYLPLNEGEGKIVKDVSGHNFVGEINNDENTKWVEGRQGGKALHLGGSNGKGSFIYVKDFKAATLQKPFTVSLYFKPDSTVYKRESIWHLLCNGRGKNGIMLGIHYQRILLGGDSSNYSHYAASNYAKNPFKADEWVHFAGTYDGTGVYKVYIDGALAGVSTGDACAPVNGGSDCLCIGSQFGYAPAVGTICDVKIFNRALTDAEILQENLGE